ncbi:MAG TPA: 3-phosphoshikimate 1-carboxyvinyltransferase [Phycisphaerales bacterium]|nr:3-phosphoshikimate 1-carboxyvinyltransferase [Phycisphaerales bacterium]
MPGDELAPSIGVLARPLGDLPDPLPIPVMRRPFDASASPPGSKSIANRALLLAALAGGESVIRNLPVGADDVDVMVRALGQLGARLRVESPGDRGVSIRVSGVGGRWRVPPEGVRLDARGAGTAARFLMAAALLGAPGSGPITIDGNAQLRARPMGGLAAALRALGAQVRSQTDRDRLPMRIVPPADPDRVPGSVEIGAGESSQFRSALMLVAPFLPRGLTIVATAPPPSPGYIEMTHRLLCAVGGAVSGSDPATGPCGSAYVPRWSAAPGGIAGFELDVEPDASSAAVLLTAAVLTGSALAVPGLTVGGSLQPDAGFVRVAEAFGARARPGGLVGVRGSGPLRPIDVTLRPMPDTALVAAVLAGFVPGEGGRPRTTTLRGLGTLRDKECDRLAALRAELAKVGVEVEIITAGADEGLRLTPAPGGIGWGPSVAPVVFETYDDHRVAMALALIGLRRAGVAVRNPACVAKSYPAFWRDLAGLCGKGSA